MNEVKQAVFDVFGKDTAELLWSNNLYRAIMVTPQDFSIQAILPAVLYMFRWGKRRGTGEFRKIFGLPRGERDWLPPTSSNVVEVLLAKSEAQFNGFDNENTKNILKDLLLAFCFENKGHKQGHNIELQRVYPTHYFSSWVDLPKKITDLRFVPELLAVLLANQPKNNKLVQTPDFIDTSFPWGSKFEENLLFQKFGTGVRMSKFATDLGGDDFVEDADVTLDQLLMIRIAKLCTYAPQGMKGGLADVPNAFPLASKAAKGIRNDIVSFIEKYAETLPRQSFISLFETLLGFGLYQIFLNTAKVVIEWDANGNLPNFEEQSSPPVFADASCGMDRELRIAAEESFNNSIMSLLAQTPKSFMALRIMDVFGMVDPVLRKIKPVGPDAHEWVNTLGKVRYKGHSQSAVFLYTLEQSCLRLAGRNEVKEVAPFVTQLLDSSVEDVVGKLAEALSSLMGRKIQFVQLLKFIDSSMIADTPNGFGAKRRIRLSRTVDGKRSMDVRSLIMSNSLLEVLVHRHLVHGKNEETKEMILSLPRFLEILRIRYGIFIDRSPLGTQIPDILLRRNREYLERRLRDLGLLTGVNDAENMKMLRARYKMSETST